MSDTLADMHQVYDGHEFSQTCYAQHLSTFERALLATPELSR